MQRESTCHTLQDFQHIFWRAPQSGLTTGDDYGTLHYFRMCRQRSYPALLILWLRQQQRTKILLTNKLLDRQLELIQ